MAEAIAWVDGHAVDVAIVDIALAGDRGAAFVRYLRPRQPDCKLFAISGTDEPTQLAEMLRAGATGLALKSQSAADIVEAIRCVAAGGQSVPSGLRAQIDALVNSPEAWSVERLTRREREILTLLLAGETSKAIATKLYISPRTVDTHRQRMMNKLGAHSPTQLFHVALQHGLV